MGRLMMLRSVKSNIVKKFREGSLEYMDCNVTRYGQHGMN